MTAHWIRPFFILAGIYDGVLGLAFVFFAPEIFQAFGVAPPNHFGYVHFPALLLLIFAAMFFRIARDPARNRSLILYGVALKIAYAGSVFWYHMNGGVPAMWIPWAWADVAFLAVFLIAFQKTKAPVPA